MKSERLNQKARTRAAIVDAARALMHDGVEPTIAEVAERALVSPATAYRYFPSSEALWRAIGPDRGDPAEVLGDTDDVAERVERMVRIAGWAQYDEELLWRTALRAVLAPPGKSNDGDWARQGQRMRWIDEALRPLAAALSPRELQRLRSGLALVFGMESLVTLRDVCGLDPDDAKDVSLWAARTLLDSVLSRSRRRSPAIAST